MESKEPYFFFQRTARKNSMRLQSPATVPRRVILRSGRSNPSASIGRHCSRTMTVGKLPRRSKRIRFGTFRIEAERHAFTTSMWKLAAVGLGVSTMRSPRGSKMSLGVQSLANRDLPSHCSYQKAPIVSARLLHPVSAWLRFPSNGEFFRLLQVAQVDEKS